MLTISVDRYEISDYLKATVNVLSDSPITAYEARATLASQAFGRGIGYDLLSDDISTSTGIVIPTSPITSFSFDIHSTELSADGDYRISVYVRDSNGEWNDCCQLLTDTGYEVFDSTGAAIYVQRNGSGTDTGYMSSYSGDTINYFIGAVT